MPTHDWACSTCGHTILDRYEPRLEPTIPDCPNEGGIVLGGVKIVPAIQVHQGLWCLIQHHMERLWTTNKGIGSFKEFEYEHDDGRKETITSLSRVRAIESETAALAAGGLGRPIVFRQYSQNPSNMDRNVFGPPPDYTPKYHGRRKNIAVRRTSGPRE